MRQLVYKSVSLTTGFGYSCLVNTLKNASMLVWSNAESKASIRLLFSSILLIFVNLNFTQVLLRRNFGYI